MVIHVDAVTSAEDVSGSDLHERTVALTPLTVQYACFSMNVKTQKINITKEKITLFFPMEVYMERNMVAIVTIDGAEARG